MPPAVGPGVWIWAAFDPILIAVAIYLGWRADQAGKIALAAIAALGIALLADWVLTAIGLPLPAPVSRTGPLLMPVRAVAAVIWSAGSYAAHRLYRQP